MGGFLMCAVNMRLPESVWLVDGSSGLGEGTGPLHSSCAGEACHTSAAHYSTRVFSSHFLAFAHLVCALFFPFFVNKREGLPADFGALAWGVLACLKHPPLRREPPVKKGLELRPLNGTKKDHGFCKETTLRKRSTHCVHSTLTALFQSLNEDIGAAQVCSTDCIEIHNMKIQLNQKVNLHVKQKAGTSLAKQK